MNKISKQNDADKLREILEYFKHLRKYITISAFAILAVVLLSLPIPYLNMRLVDEVLVGKNYNSFKTIIFIWGALLLLIPFMNSMKAFCLAIFDLRFHYAIKSDITNRIIHMPMSFFIKNQSGYIESRIDDDIRSLNTISAGRLLEIFSDCIKLIFGLIMMLYINPNLTVVSLCIIPLTLLNNYIFSNRVKKISKEVSEVWAIQRGNIFETIFGIETVKLFVLETKRLLEFYEKYENGIKVTTKKVLVDVVSGYANTVISGLAPLIIWAYGGWLIIDKQLTIGEITAFIGYISFVIGPALNLASLKLNIQSALASWERIQELLNMKDEIAVAKDKPPIEIEKGKIVFQNVSYCYEGQEDSALKNINLQINPGERVAILGTNGSGKSTLMRLLLQIQTGYVGCIYIDGQDISEYNVQSLRKQIIVVSQDVFLFNGTILDNIKICNENATEENVSDIIEKINLGETIDLLPEGLNTVVQERGQNLSGGQKQMISIARAMLKGNNRILIFDEATSSLDPTIEMSLCANMDKLCEQSTFINIAHRPALLHTVSRIIVLEKGEVVFDGSKDKYFEQYGT